MTMLCGRLDLFLTARRAAELLDDGLAAAARKDQPDVLQQLRLHAAKACEEHRTPVGVV